MPDMQGTQSPEYPKCQTVAQVYKLAGLGSAETEEKVSTVLLGEKNF
jgi:hypothetical protein